MKESQQQKVQVEYDFLISSAFPIWSKKPAFAERADEISDWYG